MRARARARVLGLSWGCLVRAAPLECKKYDVDSYRGCVDPSALNYCDQPKTVEADNTLCRSECPLCGRARPHRPGSL